ncbi:MAG: DUF948 domain-containing protein [Desulfuromonadaceae bacterium]|nr:DUF948 domain-containing protein [Desulfuromonadaceae bacterium]
MQTDVILIIAVVLAAVLVAFIIPTLIQLKKTLAKVADLTEDTRCELTPILSELRTTTARLNQMLDQAEKGLGKAQGLFQAVGEIGDSVRTMHNFVRCDLNRHLGSAVGVWMGIRAAAKVIAKERERKE